MSDSNLVFVKLGGSLITDKDRAETARVDMIRDLLEQIQLAWKDDPTLEIVLGHGSGSFGHQAAKKYNTREGVLTPEQWQGYQKVWQSAHHLNQIVLEQAEFVGLPVINFPPSAAVTAQNHAIASWNLEPILSALDHKHLPLVFGDVVIDKIIGGTILSTEDLFFHLAHFLHPKKIYLAGIEKGVYSDFPDMTRLIEEIPANKPLADELHGSGSVDVTGGMRSKVVLMQELVQNTPGLEVRIFSALEPGMLLRALQGVPIGTFIH